MEKSMQSFDKFLASTTIAMLASGGAIAQITNTGRRRQIRLAAASVSAPILPTRKVPVFVNYLLACTGMEVWNMLH